MGYIGADPALNESVTSAQIADDAITLAKMASGTDGAMLTYDASGNPVAITGTDGQVATSAGADAVSAFEAAPSIDGITDNSNANAITIDSSENVAIDSGNLVISTHGKGIDFSANTDDAAGMTAELLDDYEEGTWDAVVTDGSNPMTMSANYDTGYYTKVGNLVTISGYFITTSLGDPAANGNIRITGLPFTIANNSTAWAGGAAGYGSGLDITAGESISCYGVINTTDLYLANWDATGGVTDMQASEWSADGNLMVSLSYRAA